MVQDYHSYATCRDMLVGCMLNFYILGLVTILYIAYLSKRYLDHVAIKALLATVATISVTQTILSAITTLRVVKRSQSEPVDIETILYELKALQALYGACAVLVSSYFITRIYSLTESLAVAVVLWLLTATSFVLKLSVAAVAFRLDGMGRISKRISESLVDLQWTQSIIEAMLSFSMTSTLTLIVIRHRRTHGPGWHVRVLRSVLLETALPAVPFTVAMCYVKVAGEPFIAARTYSNVMIVCLLTTLCARPTRLVPPGVKRGSATTTSTATPTNNGSANLQLSLQDRRRSSITVVPFSVGGLVCVEARPINLTATHVGATALEAENGAATAMAEVRLASNGLHGNSRHSPSCPSPRHQWRFSWPARSQPGSSASSERESIPPTHLAPTNVQDEEQKETQQQQLSSENVAPDAHPVCRFAPHSSPSWLQVPRPKLHRSSSPSKRGSHPERVAFRRSLSFQSGKLSSLPDAQISSLRLPSPLYKPRRQMSIDDLAINFGRPSPSDEQGSSPAVSSPAIHPVDTPAGSTSLGSSSSGTPSELSFRCRGDVPLTPLGSAFPSSPSLTQTHIAEASATEAQEASRAEEDRRSLVLASTPAEVWRQTHPDSIRTPSSTRLAALPTSVHTSPALPPTRPPIAATSSLPLSKPSLNRSMSDADGKAGVLGTNAFDDLLCHPTTTTSNSTLRTSHDATTAMQLHTSKDKVQGAHDSIRLTLVTRRASL